MAYRIPPQQSDFMCKFDENLLGFTQRLSNQVRHALRAQFLLPEVFIDDVAMELIKGESDANVISEATAANRVLITQDADFLSAGKHHRGAIVLKGGLNISGAWKGISYLEGRNKYSALLNMFTSHFRTMESVRRNRTVIIAELSGRISANNTHIKWVFRAPTRKEEAHYRRRKLEKEKARN